jgi:hypothetical protein
MAKRTTGTARGAQSRVLQIKVTLQGWRPPVWRRLLVPAGFSLEQLHHVIQAAMGWQDCHLHQLIVGRTYCAPLPPEDLDFGWDDDKEDEAKVSLGSLIRRKGQSFLYEYDFGDSWQHKVLVEKLLEAEDGVQYPVCPAGKRACPPEDCGGVWGYEALLEALADPDHPDHEDMVEWAGQIDPEAFDLQAANKRLDKLR